MCVYMYICECMYIYIYTHLYIVVYTSIVCIYIRSNHQEDPAQTATLGHGTHSLDAVDLVGLKVTGDPNVPSGTFPTPHFQFPNPEPKTTNPKPQTTNHKPQTTNHKPQTPNPTPQVPNPKPCCTVQTAQPALIGNSDPELHISLSLFLFLSRPLSLTHTLSQVDGQGARRAPHPAVAGDF